MKMNPHEQKLMPQFGTKFPKNGYSAIRANIQVKDTFEIEKLPFSGP